MFNNAPILDDEIADIVYVTLWNVEVGKDGVVSSASLGYVLDLAAGFMPCDFQPTDEYLRNARSEIAQLNWQYIEENGTPNEQSAYGYVLKSDPNKAVCSNDFER
jgi:hypothetical protein